MLQIQDWIVNYGLVIVITVVIAYALLRFSIVLLSKLIRKTVTQDANPQDNKKRQDTIINLVSIMLRIVTWSLAISILAINVFPVLNLSPLLISAAGVLGVAFGFGAQGLVRDFISGVFIIIENQYRIGDIVQIGGFTGKVDRFTIRSTVLRDDDGALHHITNGTINHAINKTIDYAKINVMLPVSRKTSPESIKKLISIVGKKMSEDEQWKDRLISIPVFSSIESIGETTYTVKISCKADPSSQWAVASHLRGLLLTKLRPTD